MSLDLVASRDIIEYVSDLEHVSYFVRQICRITLPMDIVTKRYGIHKQVCPAAIHGVAISQGWHIG